jgi:hypothetical protein
VLPAPADIQTADGGSTPGQVEAGDTITFTFAGAVNPDLILSGWNGSATTVNVHFDHVGAVSGFVVEDSGGSILTGLGTVGLAAHYTNTVDCNGSTMTLSGITVQIVLGTPTGNGIHAVSVPSTLTWAAPTGTSTESGVPDVDF